MLIAFCVVVFIASFYVAVSRDSTPAYSLAVVSFVCIVALYAAGVLGYKVGGSYLSLEDKVQALEKEGTELKEAVTALLKTIYFVSSAEMPTDGRTAKHEAIIDKYLEPVRHLTPEDVKASVNDDIRRLDERKSP